MTGNSGRIWIIAPVEMLRHFGIDSQAETVFNVVRCDGKDMTLESDYARLILRKF